jgi:hypothetical protein
MKITQGMREREQPLELLGLRCIVEFLSSSVMGFAGIVKRAAGYAT